MSPRTHEFRRSLIWSGGLHGVLILVLIGGIAWIPVRKMEAIAWFNPSASVGGVSGVAPTDVRKQSPVSSVSKAAVQEAKPGLKPVRKASIQTAPSAPSVATNPSKNNIVRKTTEPQGSGGPASTVGRADPNGWYFALVRDALYRNWQQPTLSQTLVTRVTIQVARDGRVLGVQLTTSSGNTAMDESVLESVRQVKQIEPPPAGVPSEIYIDFKLQGLG